MASERQGWTNGKPFIVTAEQCRAKWGSGDRDWKLRCYLCRTEASEGDTFRWVYMNSSTPSPGNFMVCRTCDFDGIAEAVRASLEDWKKTFGDHAGWSFQAFSKFHSTIFERDQLRAELAAAKGLLARIHRDGGHYTEAVGVTNSITDAHEKWSELLLENHNLTNELAAAKEQADRAGFNLADAKGEIAVLSRKLEDCQAACASHETANKHYYEKLEKALAEGCAFAADNERLRAVLHSAVLFLDKIHRFKLKGNFSPDHIELAMQRFALADALAATPAQSLAAHDAAVKAAVLREVAETCKFSLNGGEWRICPETLVAEADRIEKEAQRG